MRLPRKVPHGVPVPDLTDAFNALIDYVRSITPLPSATVAVSTLSNGTTFRTLPRPSCAASAASPRTLSDLQFTVSASRRSTTPGELTLSVRGGTAQAMFGAITFIPSSQQDITVPEDKHAFVSLVYRIGSPSSYIHSFDTAIDIRVAATPPANSTAVAYFPVAVVESDGSVLQGHTGAVYLAAPVNTVDVEDDV